MQNGRRSHQWKQACEFRWDALNRATAPKVQRLRNEAAAGGLAVQVELGDLETRSKSPGVVKARLEKASQWIKLTDQPLFFFEEEEEEETTSPHWLHSGYLFMPRLRRPFWTNSTQLLCEGGVRAVRTWKPGLFTSFWLLAPTCSVPVTLEYRIFWSFLGDDYVILFLRPHSAPTLGFTVSTVALDFHTFST